MTRNQTFIKGFALAALLPLLAACSNDDNGLPQDNEAQPVQINIGTRASFDGETSDWQNDDKVGLSIKGYNEQSATQYTLTYSNGSWSASPDIGEKMLPATVEAWWPNTNNASATNFNFTYSDNTYILYDDQVWIEGTVEQSSEQLLAACDWMTYNAELTSATLDINMVHRLCKVTVKINTQEGYTPTITNPRFFTIAGSDNNDNFREVIPLTTNNNGINYTAIIIPYYYQGVGHGSYPPFIKLTVDDTDQLVTLAPDFAMDFKYYGAGKAYTFNLTVNNPNATTRSESTPDCKLELVEVRDMNEE